MKHILIIALTIYTSTTWSQKKDVFFKIDNSIAYDSIYFNENKVERFNDVIKFKRNKKTKIMVFVDNKIFLFKVNSYHLGKFNVIKLNENSNLSKTELIIEKLHGISTYETHLHSDKNIQLQINVLIVSIDDKGNILTGCKEFDEYIQQNPKFFLHK